MTYQARTLLPLGPNSSADRGGAQLSIVTFTVRGTVCLSEAVGGLGGAALAPPIIVESPGAALAPPIILNQPELRSLRREPNGRP
jgi:hypothetical protein